MHADDPLPRELEGVGITERLGERLPLDLAFRNEAGEPVLLSAFFDGRRPVVLALSYYGCPMLCGLVLNGATTGLKGMAWTAGEKYRFVNVSIDPTETAELAREKKANYAPPAAGWHFLVGDAPQIQALAEAVGFRYRYDPERREYAHAAAIYVLTPDGRLSRYLYGTEFRPRDLKFAMIEATNGGIGTVTDRLLLYCYHYDPKTRRYALFATRLMRLGGAVTVGGVIVLLARTRRRKDLC